MKPIKKIRKIQIIRRKTNLITNGIKKDKRFRLKWNNLEIFIYDMEFYKKIKNFPSILNLP